MNNKNKLIQIQIFTIVTLISFALPTFAIVDDMHSELFNPPQITNGSVLNISNCVALAFKNSPKIKRKKYELDIAKGNVGVAKSKYYPVIGAGTGFNYEKNSDRVYYDRTYRDLPNVSVFVNQMIYDFGKTTANIKMEEFYKIAAEYEFMDELCDTLFDVKARYYALLKASALLSLADENIKLNKKYVKIAQKNPDLLTAQVNLSNAEIKYIEADNNLKNEKYNLSNSMYLDNHLEYSLKNTPTFNYNINKTNDIAVEPVIFPFKKEDVYDIAYKNSPDLLVLINTKNAMEQSLKYIKKSYFPELTAGVGYGLNNTNFTTNNSLQVGVGLATEINIKELKHGIDIADAKLSIADNEILLFKKDLYYEVQRALNNVDKTEQQVITSQKEVEQAIRNLKEVESGYNSKSLDYIALQTARKDYINAQEHYITSIYDYNMALIQTEMALHCHVVDIHHKTEHALHHHTEELIEHLNEVLNCDEKENSRKNNKKNRTTKL